MRHCRTKSFITYWINSFDGKGRVFIDVFPQQKWTFNREVSGAVTRMSLTRKNITIEIPKEDFEKHWRFIDEEM